MNKYIRYFVLCLYTRYLEKADNIIWVLPTQNAIHNVQLLFKFFYYDGIIYFVRRRLLRIWPFYTKSAFFRFIDLEIVTVYTLNSNLTFVNIFRSWKDTKFVKENREIIVFQFQATDNSSNLSESSSYKYFWTLYL